MKKEDYNNLIIKNNDGIVSICDFNKLIFTFLLKPLNDNCGCSVFSRPYCQLSVLEKYEEKVIEMLVFLIKNHNKTVIASLHSENQKHYINMLKKVGFIVSEDMKYRGKYDDGDILFLMYTNNKIK